MSTIFQKTTAARDREANTCDKCRGRLNPSKAGTTSFACMCPKAEPEKSNAVTREDMITMINDGVSIHEIARISGRSYGAVINSVRYVGYDAAKTHEMQKLGRERFEGEPIFKGPIRMGDFWQDPDNTQRILCVFGVLGDQFDMRSYSIHTSKQDDKEIVSEKVLRQFWIFKDHNPTGTVLRMPLD
jgi:hypothetical protein